MNASLLFTVFIFLVMCSQPAYAYLDTNTGSMILATIMGGIGGLVVLVKIFWSRIRETIGLGEKDSNKDKEQ